MAPVDVEVHNIVWSYIVPILGAYIGYKLIKPYYLEVYKKCYAFFIHRMTISYNKKLGKVKTSLFSNLQAQQDKLSTGRLTILDIGSGTGANFKFFPKNSDVICLDPNPYFESYLKSNQAEFPDVNLKQFVVGYGEDMKDVADESIDAVVCTLVLCGVAETDKTLAEIKRVLKPGGIFYFCEHVAGEPGTWTNIIQRLARPLWMKISDGCNPAQTPWINIDKAGFAKLDYKRISAGFRKRFSKLMNPHLVGTATK